MSRRALGVGTRIAAPVAIWVALTVIFPSLMAAGPKKQAPGSNGHKSSSGWQEDFSNPQLDPTVWVVGNGQAPGYIPRYHIGDYDPAHVQIVSDETGSYLQLLLTQEIGPVDSGSGILSHGALIYTKNAYGYGTYEMRMRMSSTSPTPTGDGDSVTGSVSAGFVYVNNSQTEIDFEFYGRDPDTLYMVNWLNPDPRTDPTESDETFDALYPFAVSTQFHTYKFVWQQGKITFYVDGVQKAVHTTNVPGAPAYFMINHWGTDGPYWGGYATVGTTRYFYVDWVKYTPLH
jgi:hypothetical protein